MARSLRGSLSVNVTRPVAPPPDDPCADVRAELEQAQADLAAAQDALAAQTAELDQDNAALAAAQAAQAAAEADRDAAQAHAQALLDVIGEARDTLGQVVTNLATALG